FLYSYIFMCLCILDHWLIYWGSSWGNYPRNLKPKYGNCTLCHVHRPSHPICQTEYENWFYCHYRYAHQSSCKSVYERRMGNCCRNINWRSNRDLLSKRGG